MIDMRAMGQPNHRHRSGRFDPGGGCGLARPRAAASPDLLLQQIAVRREHSRRAHAATTRVRKLSNAHRPGHVGVAMAEEERDLVNALAGQQSSARDGMPEAMHRGEISVPHLDSPAAIVVRMKNREGGMAGVVGRLPLCLPKRPRHIPLPEWPAGPRAEHEVGRLGESRRELVMSGHQGQLARDRHCSCRSVRLRRVSAAVTVDLATELELGLFEIAKSRIRQVNASSSERRAPVRGRDGEQRPVRLPRGPDGLLQFATLEDPPALSLRWPRPLRGKHEGHRIRARPTKPASGISLDAIRNAEDDHDGGFGEPSASQLPHQDRQVVWRDRITAPRAERWKLGWASSPKRR
jgi:hypothetical protein